ncbi:hypothetical protein [Marinobacter nauticus]|uniref:hypothetical protein n=1 Tax=Marinobacter nauticus TaxID=2743 RepID=UPI000256EB30|nr:hypothetical protein [Marinobacter nauticus]MCG8524067.1 hypothetical protein [Pseudomonadales bacterium]MEC9039045.1 hypothetical protein [Pseudomonadota bacterium]CCG97209.1 conserved hypothetical protein; putative membrane protein [Marinobacter nauticus ATCC 49840]
MLPLRSALAYVALLSAILASLPGMTYLGAAAAGATVLLGWQDMRNVPRVVFVVALVMLVFALGYDPELIETASGNMTRLAGLMLAVMLLSNVLARTEDLQQISVSLFGGKPLARYLSLAFGTSLVSVPLNFGSVAVVGSLVGERIRRNGDSESTRNATRAVLRGFGVAPMFSPLSISVVLTLTLLPQVSLLSLLLLAVPFSVLMVLAGLHWREPEPLQSTERSVNRAGAGSWLRFGGLILAICVGVLWLSHRFGLSYAHAVALSCLAAVLLYRILGWLKRENPPLASMANVSNELAIVGGSAFIGAVLSGVVLGQISGQPELPVWLWALLAAGVPWVFFAAGLAGMNPIIIATLIGGILGSLWPGAAQLGLAIAMVTGWGITAFGTPFAANALIMERLTGYRTRDASFRWSLALSLSGLCAASLLGFSLTLWLA